MKIDKYIQETMIRAKRRKSPWNVMLAMIIVAATGLVAAPSAGAHESSVSVKIGPKGGVIALPNRRVVATIPPGALKDETELCIFEGVGPVNREFGALRWKVDPTITHLYRFTPDVVFQVPATIRFYCDEDCPPVDPNGGWSLVIARLLPDGEASIEPDSNLSEVTESFGQNPVPEEKYVELTTVFWNRTRLLLDTK